MKASLFNNRRRRQPRLTALLVSLAALVAAPGANAAVSCAHSNTANSLRVTVTGPSSSVGLEVAPSGLLIVRHLGDQLDCFAGPATTTNTDIVRVVDSAGIDTSVHIVEPTRFAPGLTPEAGDDEIEFDLSLGHDSPGDEVRVRDARILAQFWRVGTGGINFNADEGPTTSDAETGPLGNTGVDSLELQSYAGDDGISLQGGGGTGSPYPALGDLTAADVTVEGNGGDDLLEGGAGPDRIDGGPGRDVIRGFGASDGLTGGEGPDDIDGGSGQNNLIGSDGPDTLQGGDDKDFIEGGADQDVIRGFEGSDVLRGGGEADVIDGGAGQNSLSGGGGSDIVQGGDDADEINGEEGQDTLRAFGGPDVLVGGDDADAIDGGAGDNILRGGGGPDQLFGLAGTNTLDGGDGFDLANFESATAPVSVDLDVSGPQDTGVATNTFVGVEGVLGGAGPDRLVGDGGSNLLAGRGGGDTLVGRGGTDTIFGDAGADSLFIRDDEADTANCGDGSDTVEADRASLDTVNADCETTDLLPEPEQPQNGPADPGTGDPGTAPDLSLSFALRGARSQRVLAKRAVRVRVSCPLEPCTTRVRATARVGRSGAAARLRLAPVSAAVAAGSTRRVVLRLTSRQRAALRPALAAGRTPTLRVSARARDAAGNRVERTLRVAVKR